MIERSLLKVRPIYAELMVAGLGVTAFVLGLSGQEAETSTLKQRETAILAEHGLTGDELLDARRYRAGFKSDAFKAVNQERFVDLEVMLQETKGDHRWKILQTEREIRALKEFTDLFQPSDNVERTSADLVFARNYGVNLDILLNTLLVFGLFAPIGLFCRRLIFRGLKKPDST